MWIRRNFPTGTNPMRLKLNPHISVDCVVFGFDSGSLKVLLVERMFSDGHSGEAVSDLKLPGSLVYDNENLDNAAYRVLRELTGIDHIYLEQLSVFDSPERTSSATDRNWLQHETGIEIGRIISVAYFALIRFEKMMELLSRMNQKTHWTEARHPGRLPFDHNMIVRKGLEHLQTRMQIEPIAMELLPRKFTLRQLQEVYEVLLGREMDNRNFRKKLHRNGYFVPLDEKEKDVAHKPARLYTFDKTRYERNKKDSVIFSI